MALLAELGGVEGLAKSLMSSTSTGLDPHAEGDASLHSHQECYGKNEFAAQPSKSFWMLMYQNMQVGRLSIGPTNKPSIYIHTFTHPSIRP